MPPRQATRGGGSQEGAGATAAQHQEKAPKPLTDEQVDKIVKQVEFYFSDANLPTDAFLMKKVRADPNGFVPIGVVCGFNRMKTLLKKHPPIETVAAILREHSEALVVSEDGIRVRRATPLPDIDLEDVQARTVVAENFKTPPTIESVRDLFSAAGDVAMVRVRHPGMQTPAGATKPSGLDLIATPSNAVHALIEFKTRDDAALRGGDAERRQGLAKRPAGQAAGEERSQEEEAAEAAAAETRGRTRGGGGGREPRRGGGGGEGGEGGGEGEGVGGDGAAPKKNKKKGKWGRQGKKDYSQWASAAAFQENKAFLEADDGGGDGGGDGGVRRDDGEERRTTSRSQAAAADPVAPRQPTMPDGTRGFRPGAGRGRPQPPPPPA